MMFARVLVLWCAATIGVCEDISETSSLMDDIEPVTDWLPPNFTIAQIKTVYNGEEGQPFFSTNFEYDGQRISPWHDIPLFLNDADPLSPEATFAFVCEIPKGTSAKMEVNKEQPYNPIMQDKKKDGSLRYYKYSDSLVNYGALMQTWEDPEFKNADTGVGGDNDPIDVLQINSRPCSRTGEVQAVRVLGCLALLDGDETDWKMIVVDSEDPEFASMKDIDDVPVEKVDELREWFRNYKTAEGKPKNKFGLDEKAMGREYCAKVIQETHDSWLQLMHGRRALEPHTMQFSALYLKMGKYYGKPPQECTKEQDDPDIIEVDAFSANTEELKDEM